MAIRKIDPRYGGLKVRENDCSNVWTQPTDKRCEWVKNEINCASDSVIQYTHLLFCVFTNEFLFVIGLLILVLWLLYLFLILGTTADNFFCPSLAVIAQVLHLSENIAGVTILAFGNGAPDIFTSLVSDDREMVIMFTELIGAGIFVTAIIAGSVAVVAPFKIPYKSFVRDCSFYIISVCWIGFISQDQVIHIWEALSLVLIYVLFIIVVIVMQFHEKSEEKRKGRMPRLRDPELLKTYVAYRAREGSIESPKALPLRSRAYSLRAKLDVAIAAELNRQKIDNPTANPSPSADEDETTPHISHRPSTLFAEFLYDINPINEQDWQASGILVRIVLILRAPVMLILQTMIPVVNETAENRGWSKLLNSLQLMITPILALFKLNVWNNKIGPVPILVPVVVVGSCCSGFVFLKTSIKKCPKYHDGFAFLGFLGAMLVVYIIANEVMAILQCIGYASGITDAMLGITLLAWGNSIGDLISNVAIAKRGFPRMGFAACFGGPLFNTLLGLGLSWTISAKNHHEYFTKIRTSDMMLGCLAFLLASLGASMVYGIIRGFSAHRSYGYLLYSIYFTFMLINILSEVHFIHPLGTDHRED